MRRQGVDGWMDKRKGGRERRTGKKRNQSHAVHIAFSIIKPASHLLIWSAESDDLGRPPILLFPCFYISAVRSLDMFTLIINLEEASSVSCVYVFILTVYTITLLSAINLTYVGDISIYIYTHT